jgi:ABC-2 type transport system permease protein
MRSLIAFTKKEFTDQLRSGKVLFLGILFLLFGIMNPAVAKLTPWLLKLFADSLAGSGITVTEATVSAIDSWAQFFKNIPIGLIAFALLQSSVLTKEVSSGALILSLTKGLQRYKAVVSKSTVLLFRKTWLKQSSSAMNKVHSLELRHKVRQGTSNWPTTAHCS